MQDIKTIEGTEVMNVNDPIQGSHAITLNDLINKVRPYKVYTALLNQSGTNAPVATVLENTTGLTITWSRFQVGVYRGQLSALQDETKVWFLTSWASGAGDATQILYSLYNGNVNNNYLQIGTSDYNQTLYDADTEFPMLIELRIYP